MAGDYETASASEVDVDKIMERIRAEVARIRCVSPRIGNANVHMPAGAHMESIRTNFSETRLWRILKTIQDKLRSRAFYNIIYGFALRLKKHIPKYVTHFSIGDFAKYHDEDFIRHAYLGILQREADPQGFETFLKKLRVGELRKSEILGRLRYSREGKGKRVRVRGLLLRVIAASLLRVPIVGYLMDIVLSLLRFPKILKNAREYEALTAMRFAQQKKAASQSLYDLQSKLAHVINAIEAKADAGVVQSLSGEVEEHKRNILDQQRRLSILLEEKQAKLSEPISQRLKNILIEEDRLLDAMYVAFEDRFRGTRADIRQRLKVYLPYMKLVKTGSEILPILDIGCGRGEWLELLNETGFRARGVDINKIMIQQCADLGFDVTESDAIGYLRNQKTDSICAITGFHIIEHLPLNEIISLFDESLRVLTPGGIIIFETPNPENIIVGSCSFYIDLNHKRPLPPESVKFLAEQRGFVNTQILRLHRLKEQGDIIPNHSDELLQRMYMEQDYAIIAYKA